MISKTAAGGLSAGIFLLWWPGHLPTEGLGWLVLRGVLWTLVFEALLLSFVPLERMLCAGIRLDRGRALRARIAAAPVRVRVGAAIALAVAGLAGPVALLADGAKTPSANARAERPTVIRQVVVERPVVKRRVVVRRVAVPTAPVATAAVEPAAAPAAPATTRPQRRTHDEGAVDRRAAARTERKAAPQPGEAKAPAEQTPAAAQQEAAAPETPDGAPEAGASSSPAPAV